MGIDGSIACATKASALGAVHDPHTANDSENGLQMIPRGIEMAWTRVTGSSYKVVTITTSILKTK